MASSQMAKWDRSGGLVFNWQLQICQIEAACCVTEPIFNPLSLSMAQWRLMGAPLYVQRMERLIAFGGVRVQLARDIVIALKCQ